MKLRLFPPLAAISIVLGFALGAASARRPRYGGTLRMEIGATVRSLDPEIAASNAEEAAAKSQLDALIYRRQQPSGKFFGTEGLGAFSVTAWEPGKRITLAANDNFVGGRSFIDAIEIQMGRSARDRLLDLQVGRADLAEIAPEQARQAANRGVRLTNSQPDELLAVVFLVGRPGTDDIRVRRALADAIDRVPIVDFILQKEAEPAGGLLPQWSSGTAFLFSTAADATSAKELWAQIGEAPQLALGYDSGDTLEKAVAERIVVNALEAGIPLSAQPAGTSVPAKISARLIRLHMISPLPQVALSDFILTLAPLTSIDPETPPISPEPLDIYHREDKIVRDYRVIPLVWIPRVYGVNARVRDWSPPISGAVWPLADVWLEGAVQ